MRKTASRRPFPAARCPGQTDGRGRARPLNQASCARMSDSRTTMNWSSDSCDDRRVGLMRDAGGETQGETGETRRTAFQTAAARARRQSNRRSRPRKHSQALKTTRRTSNSVPLYLLYITVAPTGTLGAAVLPSSSFLPEPTATTSPKVGLSDSVVSSTPPAVLPSAWAHCARGGKDEGGDGGGGVQRLADRGRDRKGAPGGQGDLANDQPEPPRQTRSRPPPPPITTSAAIPRPPAPP